MDLARAASKFCSSPIEVWDAISADWEATPYRGALQVFDRFITERTFGQKKRTLLVPAEEKLPLEYAVIRLEGSEEAFLVEKFNEDVRHGKVYSYIYLLHEATHYVELMKNSMQENAAGIAIPTGEALVEATWIDMDRFSSAPSKKMFEEVEYTIVNMTFPRGSLVDTDCYVKLSNGERYNVDEVYYSLDLKQAYGKRIGL